MLAWLAIILQHGKVTLAILEYGLGNDFHDAIWPGEAADAGGRLQPGCGGISSGTLIYSETGRYAESLDLNEQALANARSIMGEKHSYVAQMIVRRERSLSSGPVRRSGTAPASGDRDAA